MDRVIVTLKRFEILRRLESGNKRMFLAKCCSYSAVTTVSARRSFRPTTSPFRDMNDYLRGLHDRSDPEPSVEEAWRRIRLKTNQAGTGRYARVNFNSW